MTPLHIILWTIVWTGFACSTLWLWVFRSSWLALEQTEIQTLHAKLTALETAFEVKFAAAKAKIETLESKLFHPSSPAAAVPPTSATPPPVSGASTATPLPNS